MFKTVLGILTLVSFAFFFTNVILGSIFDARFLSDVGEMLSLTVSCVLMAGMFIAFERGGDASKK